MMLTRNIYKYLSIPVGIILVFLFRIVPGACFILALAAIFTLGIKVFAKENSHFLITIFISALAIRLICATALYLFSLHGGYGGFLGGDESVYYKRGINIAAAGSIDSKNLFSNTPELGDRGFAVNLFSVMESILIFTFGPSLILIKYFNSIIGALLPVSVFLLAKTIYNNDKLAKAASILSAFFPSLIIWSAIGTKEALTILIITGIFYFHIKNSKKLSFLYSVNILVLIACLLFLQHIPALVFIAVYILWMMCRNLNKFMGKEVTLMICILIGSLIFLTHQKNIGKILYDISLHQVHQFLAGSNDSSRFKLYPYKSKYPFYDFYEHIVVPEDVFNNITPYDSTAVIKNSIIKIRWINYLYSYVKGLGYALFAPFPWDIRSSLQLIIYPQIIFWWCIIPYILYGIIWSLRFKSKETGLLIFFITCIYSLMALTEGNIGSVFRHRDWVTPFGLMFAALGFMCIFVPGSTKELINITHSSKEK